LNQPAPSQIPEPLRGLEIRSFAHYTITVRLPAIGRSILEENDLPVHVQGRVQALVAELPFAGVKPLEDPGAPDLVAWQHYLRPYLGEDWLQIPWFLAETYFYRRVLEATGYFQPGPGLGRDPYAYQKSQGLERFRKSIQAACAQLEASRDQEVDSRRELLVQWLFFNLWGNQVDLSLWPVGQANRPEHAEDAQRQHLVSDHTRAAAEYLADPHSRMQRIDILLDNAGLELVYDLLLVDFLLDREFSQCIHLHAKPHPTFVSDAMVKDIHHTLAFLRDSPALQTYSVGQRLENYFRDGRLQAHDHYFWTSPLSMWELPEDLKKDILQSNLLISKGDANYRRFLGDRHWAFDTQLASVLNYLPVPWLGLRVSKSQVMIGLGSGQAEKLAAIDADWMTDGRWGLIQFYNGRRK